VFDSHQNDSLSTAPAYIVHFTNQDTTTEHSLHSVFHHSVSHIHSNLQAANHSRAQPFPTHTIIACGVLMPEDWSGTLVLATNDGRSGSEAVLARDPMDTVGRAGC
jgi:hypothetical protein